MHPMLTAEVVRDHRARLTAEAAVSRSVPRPPGWRAELLAARLRVGLHLAERRALALERRSRQLADLLAEVEQRAGAARSRLAGVAPAG